MKPQNTISDIEKNCVIRQSQPSDLTTIKTVVEEAFKEEIYSDHQEQNLVERLMSAPEFVPELSLVATIDDQIVGYILFTPIKIQNDLEEFASLSLAPVAVLPNFQHKGIGGALIRAGHQAAKECGYSSVVILGHAEYYPRFGYKQADQWGIQLPFEVEPEYCMAIELQPDSLTNVSGKVVYPAAFEG